MQTPVPHTKTTESRDYPWRPSRKLHFYEASNMTSKSLKFENTSLSSTKPFLIHFSTTRVDP